MVGQVHTDDSEMGIGNVFLTEVRARYITFTVPFDFERACFITPAPRPLPTWMAVSFPFTLNVWILLVGSVLGLTVLVPVFGAGLMVRDYQELHSLSASFLLILAQFSNQSTRRPARTPMQVLVGFIMMCGFVVSVFYSSNLTAFMMVRAVEQPYTSIRQIVQSELQVGGYSDFWLAIFQGSANQDVRSLSQKFFRFDNVTKFLQSIISRQGVLLENTKHLEYLQKTFLTNRVGESSVRLMLEECINPFGVGVMLKRNSPLKSSADTMIQRMREAGLVDKFFKEVLQEARGPATQLSSNTDEATSPPPPDDHHYHHHHHHHQMTEAALPPPTPDDRRLLHHHHQMTEGYITTTTPDRRLHQHHLHHHQLTEATSPPPDDRRLLHHHHHHQMTEAALPPPTPDDRRLLHHHHQMTEGYITTTTTR
ncbi:Ionotropic receptor 21a-like 14 [Homarus americanus]|uniref:Ionotropic receptor 21a-like 14 n=1 Tax=Homarus americanus TaxID=6706 RepID=A0A8J5MND7_HOMAM|nr:Ionotropic receptor 21a-like 14 [Homarus americanus]